MHYVHTTTMRFKKDKNLLKKYYVAIKFFKSCFFINNIPNIFQETKYYALGKYSKIILIPNTQSI